MASVLLATLAPAGAQAQILSGSLLDAGSGQAILLGYVALLNPDGDQVAWTLTDEDGFFRLQAPSPGDYLVYGESLGYRSLVDGPIRLGEDAVARAEFRLDPMPLVLDSLRVEAERRPRSLVLSGFYDRESAGVGYFIGPERIREHLEARNLTDLFWSVPGVRLMPRSNLAGSGYVPMMRASAGMRGFCLPVVYIDGIRAPGADQLDELIAPRDVEGLEVYRSASEIPARFSTAGANCGVLLIWSRKGG